MATEEPGLIKIVFDYPFHLGLPSVYVPVALDEEEHIALVKVRGREGVQIYDKTKLLRRAENNDVVLEDIPEAAESRNMQVVGTGENDQPAFHYVVGDFGKASYPWHYTTVEVVFSVSDVNSAWSHPKNAEFVNKMTREFFNKLLLAYRHVSGEIFNKYLSEANDLSMSRRIYISPYTEEENRVATLDLLTPAKVEARVFRPFPMRGAQSTEDDIPLVQANIASPLSMNAQKKEIPPEKVVELMRASANVQKVTIFNEVFLSAMERLGMDKDYRMAIIEMDTAVEMTVMHYLFRFLSKAGKKPDEIAELFDEENQAARDLREKGYLTVTNRIRRLEDFINTERTKKGQPVLNIFSTQEFKNWKVDVRKKRNLSCV